MFLKSFKNLLLVLSLVAIVGITSCSNSLKNQGSISILLPGTAASTNSPNRKPVQVDKNSLIFELKLEGEESFEKSGESGQTVLFDEIPYGEYTLTVNAYGNDEVLYYSAQKQVTVESENTEVSVSLKYVGPQIDDDDGNDDDDNDDDDKPENDTEIDIKIKVNDEVKDIALFENAEIKVTFEDIKENRTITLEAPEGYKTYIWFMNEEILSEVSVAEIEMTNFKNGKYILTLFVCDKDGNYYSQDLYLIVDIER